MLSVWDDLQSEIHGLKAKNLQRVLRPLSKATATTIQFQNKKFINFSSNNYLGMTHHPLVIQSARKCASRWGTGSGASRLISGSLQIHHDLESAIAKLKSEESCLVFSSGYMANLAAVTALVSSQDLVLADRLNHASLIDAAKLSGAKFWVYKHLDYERLDDLLAKAQSFRRRLVITDAYFSMDGDIADLPRLKKICEHRNALLMIDEAHSTGVYGDKGQGLAGHFGLDGQIDVVMGTLSKALGSVGGFVAGNKTLTNYLIHRAREFVYTTAPSPIASAAALQAIKIISKAPQHHQRLWKNIAILRAAMQSLGYDMMNSQGPVIPILIGEEIKALKFQEYLMSQGIYAIAVRPPTVPQGTSRIRLSVSAAHTAMQLQALVDVFKKAKKKLL